MATSRSTTAWLFAMVAVAVGVVGAALIVRAVGDGDSGERTTADGTIAHVHGLGINPADGDLYAATHHGVFRISDAGEAELVSVPRDTMGFTVVGADHFLGSGHPAFRGDPLFDEDRRPLLGLIESTDGGRTWTPLSLFGDVDFHAIRSAHDLIYGFDATSGRFLVSGDGEEWEVRADPITLSDFAVDPSDPDHVVAMTDRGLSESTDGGRTWTPTDGPEVRFLSWHTERGLWGIDPDGRVFRSLDGGWEQRGALPGSPQAFLVTEDAMFAASSDGEATAIYVSTDDSGSWQVRYADDR